MPRGYPSLDENQKQEIIFKVRDKAEKVPDLAKEYGVSTKIIYNLLRRQVITPNLALEVAKLKREKEVLLQMVGQFVFEDRKKNKKNISKNQI
jgi:hypothetical protein